MLKKAIYLSILVLTSYVINAQTAAGSDKQVQYNSNGSLAGSSVVTVMNTDEQVRISNSSPIWALLATNTDIDAHGIIGAYGPLTTNATNGKALGVGVNGESYARSFFYTDGSFGVGGGASTRDVFFSRSAVNTFQISSDRANGAANLLVTGNVGVGTQNINDANYKLFVETGIRTRKVKVDQSNWADYVFAPTYRLPSLQEVEAFIKQHRHLPDVPSEEEVRKEGLNLGDNQAILLRKIEELTLYVIEQSKITEKLMEENNTLREEIKEVKRAYQD